MAILNTLLTGIIDYRGKTPPNSEEGIPVITAAHVKKGKVIHDNKKFVSEEVYENWTTRGFIKSGDVLITTEAPVGQVAFVPSDRTYLITRRVIALQTDKEKIDEKYLLYYLLQDRVRKHLELLAHGSTVPRIFKDDITNISIDLPHLSVQQIISSILSTYDNLIENNTRRIQILEEMAQRIYKEWFVDFKYPGHENDELVDSELGMIPERWKVKRFGEIFNINRGISHKGKYLSTQGLPLVNLKSVNPGGGYRRDGLKYYTGNYSEKHTVKYGDIFIANTDLTQAGTIIGNAAIVPDIGNGRDILITHHMYIVRFNQSNSDFKYFIYLTLNSYEHKGHSKAHASGTTVLGLQQKSVLGFRIPVPHTNLLKKFDDIIQSIYSNIEICHQKNENLRQTRDLLLPKLISGKVDVSNLDIDTCILDD